MDAFVLVHSPLVGPATWSLVVDEMQRRGITAIAPELPDSRSVEPPFWKHHAEAVARGMEAIPTGQRVVLVGHSGGGMLLPAVRAVSGRDVAAYVFVDAGIPEDGKSRLDFFGAEEAQGFRAGAVDGLLPTWTEANLAAVLHDPRVRKQFVSELRPLPLAVYEEPIPVFDGWPDAPCAYLQFTATYDEPAAQARQAGWTYRRLDGTHFHMLNEPVSVADTLVALAAR